MKRLLWLKLIALLAVFAFGSYLYGEGWVPFIIGALLALGLAGLLIIYGRRHA